MSTFSGFSDTFLAPYYAKRDAFKSLLARSTYLTKYSRNGECWTDTVVRVVRGNIELDPTAVQAEAEALFDLIWNMKVLPPGRGLWTGGISGMVADARYNCMKGDTLFWSDFELRTLREMSGKTTRVLCRDGVWRNAEIRNFGTQRLNRITFGPSTSGKSKFQMSFDATPDHGWYTTNRGRVTDLRVGDKVCITPSSVEKTNEAYRAGFLHGLVYGDGSYPPSYNGDPIVQIRSTKSMKDLPHSSETLSYQAGFLDGWLSTDGFSMKGNHIGISVSDVGGISWIKERAPLLGYCITGETTESSTHTNYGPRRSRLMRLVMTTSPVDYVVRSIEDTGLEEEVFCAVEPETRSFALVGGMPTSNCWYTTIRGVEDWCWVANQLMLGGGVGVGLLEIDHLPIVKESGTSFLDIGCVSYHPNADEVRANPTDYLIDLGQTFYTVPDSREGWIEALRLTLHHALTGNRLTIDVSGVRARGEPIRTFGGIACGPGPLVAMLRDVWAIVRGAQGRKLTSVECLDITNHLGLCIKSGNVRRSALIALGAANDQAFRDAKKNADAVYSFRHTSNNSIAFTSWAEMGLFDWEALVKDMTEGLGGEPGILNLPLVRMTDPGAKGINPCGEQALEDREACNLGEVFPALMDTEEERILAFVLMTRYCLRQRVTPLTDSSSDLMRLKNNRIGVACGGLCDFTWTQAQLKSYYDAVWMESRLYAKQLGMNPPLTVTTVKPSGTISLLNGSSPGIHAAYAPFYVRRVRMAKNDPLAGAMIAAGVPHEDCLYDETKRSWVFSFPTAKPGALAYVVTENISDQFERQVAVQESFTDNAVSATLSFRDDEKAELAKLLPLYVPRLKSTSCLPKSHGYAQAPYEEITEEEYHRMYALIDHESQLVKGGDFEIEECAGGACPIR